MENYIYWYFKSKIDFSCYVHVCPGIVAISSRSLCQCITILLAPDKWMYAKICCCITMISYNGYHWEENLKFTDDNLIGKGSTSEVFQVTLPDEFGEKVKVAAKRYKGAGSPSNNFIREIGYLKQFQNVDYIIQYLGEIRKYNVVLLEFASSGSLFDYLHCHDKLSLDQASTWSMHAAKAVQYLHKCGTMHGDIKSPNFLITTDNILKICDFGLSVSTASTGPETTTKTGTIRWMAPEVFISHNVCEKSDIYSLSLVFWELHSSEIPFADKESKTQIMWAVGKKQERPPIPDATPESMKLLMKDCWQNDFRQRPDAEEVVRKLFSIRQDKFKTRHTQNY